MLYKLLSSFLLFSCLSFAQNDKEVLKLKGVLMENDYHKSITWIKSKPIPIVQKDFTVSAYDCSYIQIYFGMYMEDSIQKMTPIRIVNVYNKPEWIFFDKISFLLGSRKEVREGKGKVFALADKDTKRDIIKGGAVKERSDVVANSQIIEMIKYIVNNDNTRMECKYINTDKSESYTQVVYDGTKKIKKHFSAFVDAYKQLTSKFNLESQL